MVPILDIILAAFAVAHESGRKPNGDGAKVYAFHACREGLQGAFMEITCR